jgi:hypothetical protein
LLALNNAGHRARAAAQDEIPADIAQFYLTLFTQAVAVGLSLHPRAPGREQTKTRNLLERLRDRADEVLRFAHNLTVPFTNNQAERDLRPAKTQLKISGCHRSATCATAWLRVRGYLSTAANTASTSSPPSTTPLQATPGHHPRYRPECLRRKTGLCHKISL